ncbi:MAG: type II secretion system protein GspM [Thermodesulfobacteriota bacterium]
MDFKTVKNKKVIIGIAVAVILFVLVVARYSYEGHLLAKEEIETKKELYTVSLGIVSEKDSIQNKLEYLDSRLKGLNAGVLTADTIPVAAAELQRLIKEMAKERGIKMSSEKVLPSIESGEFVKVPVEFQFKSMLPGLKGLIYDIESSSLILGIPKIKLKAPEFKKQNENKVTLVVEGVMKRIKDD